MNLLPLLLAAWALAAPPPSHGTWTTLPSIPLAPRQEHITVALPPSSLAILTGIIPSGPASYNTTALAQLYHIPSSTWTPLLAPVPRPLNHANAAAVAGKIYLLGGLADAPDGAWRAVSDAWVYDPAADAWTPLPPLPPGHARGSAVAGVWGSIIFLAGGMRTLVPVAGGEQDTVDVVSAYDTVGREWVDLPPAAARIPGARDHAGGAVVGHTFYVVGGRERGQANVKGEVFALDLEDLKAGWTTRAARMPTPRGGIAAAAIGGKIYTFGGEGNPDSEVGVFNQTEAYDSVTDTWERLPAMPLPRHGTSAVAIGGRVFIPGGGTKIGADPVGFFDVYRP
ncbi:hypothetical protein B0H67DRAFT_648946 [Lasiosphaeris hirsuta]|uniref:Galactose oxidase n=1 Tax=Lasiosphaeris hirsuta TaxID=260670 RepID=A0AA39ZVP8_9PEZI|nr:hypothetical protein B0H67DRAFT_648946 [Lasiosphaeris hirsuta]